MAGQKWKSTIDKETGKPVHPGVRYYKHPTRKHGIKFDHYLAIRYQKDGKRIEEGIGWTSERDPEDGQFWTEAKAALVLEKLKSAAKHGKTEAPTRISEKRAIEAKRKQAEKAKQEQQLKDSMTFEEFFTNTYLPQSKADKKSSTAQRESGFFDNWFKPILGELPLKSIKSFHLEQLKKKMIDKKQSNRSIEYALAVIRQVFNMARQISVYENEPPTSKVKKPKVDNGRMRFLTHDEANTLLQSLKEKSLDVHDMALISLHCGLRFGEIASLTWQDVDIDRSILTIRDAKAGSRFAFLTEQAATMLRNRQKGNPSDYVFPARVGGKLKKISHSFFRTVDKLKLNDGIDDPRLQICFHSCRHSYASWLIESGVDLYTVQKLLGHKTNVMTQRYAHLSENKLRAAAEALSRTFQTEEKAGHVVNFQK